MKKIIISLVLLLSLTLSLSSCLLLDRGEILYQESGETEKNPVYNIEAGDNYDVDITLNGQNHAVAASKSVLSVVSIYTEFEVYVSSFYGVQKGTEKSAGSGVIYKLDKEKGDAYIITNYHVVFNEYSTKENKIAHKINLYLYGMEGTKYAIPATYVGGSINYDLAVLKVTNSDVLKKSNATATTVANSDEVSILDTAIAIGNPKGSGISATVGYVNIDSEYIDVQISSNAVTSLRCIRIDTAVNSGNSGGGLFNDKGELIGIVNAKMSDSSVDNIGYAIPSNVAKAITDNILYYCDNTEKESVYRCMLGIKVSTTDLYTEYSAETGKVIKKEVVRIESLESYSTVKELLFAGDVINFITIDGVKHEVTRQYHVIDSMLNARVGSTVVMNVLRDGVAKDVTIEIVNSMLTAY